MKKMGVPWDAEKDDSSSDGSSSSCDSLGHKKAKTSSKTCQSFMKASTEVKYGNQKNLDIGFEALGRYGYNGGLSVLSVPAPRNTDEETKPNWSWCNGRDKEDNTQESYKERQKTRAALANGEMLADAMTRKEKAISFSQKEKRKRDMGMASRGKSYVEEEKRLLRGNGIYSGFDS